jgi:hypothetical protein
MTLDDRLMCHVESVAYYARARSGALYMAAGGQCDLAAVVALFEQIAPEVEAIQTYVAGRPDRRYARVRGVWEVVGRSRGQKHKGVL